MSALGFSAFMRMEWLCLQSTYQQGLLAPRKPCDDRRTFNRNTLVWYFNSLARVADLHRDSENFMHAATGAANLLYPRFVKTLAKDAYLLCGPDLAFLLTSPALTTPSIECNFRGRLCPAHVCSQAAVKHFTLRKRRLEVECMLVGI
jgi:hypothetical protein